MPRLGRIRIAMGGTDLVQISGYPRGSAKGLRELSECEHGYLKSLMNTDPSRVAVNRLILAVVRTNLWQGDSSVVPLWSVGGVPGHECGGDKSISSNRFSIFRSGSVLGKGVEKYDEVSKLTSNPFSPDKGY
ncbi:hypothetical protein TNCT_37791 [Trichonephila clavata]|uniref:Uncharacterized protein n=1 Tax=Trichonephila clavata TaxID=2740835 RepID=A0A8X6LCJ1_TRICU|nr:hypothetical protein TNCT_37791 [Trichonephila clavata]